MDFEFIKTNLEKKGYKVSCFETKEEAAAYLNGQIDGVSVGCGGSMTVKELGLADLLRTHNDFKWHWEGADRMEAFATDVYLSSVNGISERGEIVNIDGLGNRLAGTLNDVGCTVIFCAVPSCPEVPNHGAVHLQVLGNHGEAETQSRKARGL